MSRKSTTDAFALIPISFVRPAVGILLVGVGLLLGACDRSKPTSAAPSTAKKSAPSETKPAAARPATPVVQDDHDHGGDDHDHDGHDHAHDDGHDHSHDHAHDDGHDHSEDDGHDHSHDAKGGGHGAERVTLTPEAVSRYGVTIAKASKQRLQPTLRAPARVAFNAESMAHVGSPLPGRVIDLRARLGDVVEAGDVLFVIESPELGEAQSDYLQKRILAPSAESTAELARNALSRASGLFEQNRGIALDEVQKREVEYAAAQAALRSAQAATLAGENRLRLLGMREEAIAQLTESGDIDPRLPVSAPIAGRVVERHVTLGELVSREREALFVLADTTTLWVLADVPEVRLSEIAVGAPAWIRSGTLDGHLHSVSVTYVPPLVDPRTRSAQVRVAVECEHGALWPGMFVQVEIATRTAGKDEEVVAVPEGAIQTIEGQPSLFIPEKDANVFLRRSVRVGRAVDGMVPILDGLSSGESYVASGTFILKADLGKGSAEHSH